VQGHGEEVHWVCACTEAAQRDLRSPDPGRFTPEHGSRTPGAPAIAANGAGRCADCGAEREGIL